MTSKTGGTVTMQIPPERFLILSIQQGITGESIKEIVYNWIDLITPEQLIEAKRVMDKQDVKKLNFNLTKDRNDFVNKLADELGVSRHKVMTLIVDAILLSHF